MVSSAGKAGAGLPRYLVVHPRHTSAGMLPLQVKKPPIWPEVAHHHVCGRPLPSRLPVKDIKKPGAAHLAPSISADASPGRCLVAKANFTGTKPRLRPLRGSHRRR